MKSDTLESAKPKLTRESYDENWNMTAFTPRTDAAELELSEVNALECSRHLERELAEAKAEVEKLRSTMRSFIDFVDDNLGTTADWPMEAAFDDEETCQRHCDHLNAMKRIVKPEDIN